MSPDRDDVPPRHAVIGNADNFWLYSSHAGFDLTHPPHPSSSPVTPRATIATTTAPIAVDPAKSALMIIDMQNYFLSPALGRARGAGHAALRELVDHAIPAARRAGMRIVWVNWGLTEKEVEAMPPGVRRAFGFEVAVSSGSQHGGLDADVDSAPKERGWGVDKHGVPRVSGEGARAGQGEKFERRDMGVGSWMGVVRDPESGEEIDAGHVLMRDSWNAALYPPLDRIYNEGAKQASKPDVWIHKNRMSAMWGTGSLCEQFLEKEGLRTLFFAGVNTDQCVGGTYQDCFSKGYDCILLNDGCGTTSPDYAQSCMEFNAANTYGFLCSCRQLAAGMKSLEVRGPQVNGGRAPQTHET